MKSEERKAYIKYQIEKSRDSLKAAEILAGNKLWIPKVTRLY